MIEVGALGTMRKRDTNRDTHSENDADTFNYSNLIEIAESILPHAGNKCLVQSTGGSSQRCPGFDSR